jgi:lipoyl(octanoyl) transferase
VISVLQLGVLDYATGLRFQQRLVDLRKQGRIGDVLLLLEHTPVITLGRNAKAANIVAPAEELANRGVAVFDCDRGGDVTFHGPGQLVAYPIFDLRGFPSTNEKRKTLGAVEFVRRLEEVLIRTCAGYAISTQRIPGLTGVWTATDHVGTAAPGRAVERSSTGVSPEAKIAAIGVHISQGVTSHGLALNVNTDLTFFNLIIPCGIASRPVTSIQQQLGREVPLIEVAEALSRNFGLVFGSQILWLDSLDSLLGETVGVPMKPPAELRQLHKEEDTSWA